jgi:hypothetical protein
VASALIAGVTVASVDREEARMPLSDHDQHVLAQIEQDLCSDDVKLANTLRSVNLRSYAFRRLRRSAFLFVLGLATLIFALSTGSEIAGALLALFGFVIMLFAALRGSEVLRRLSAAKGRSQPPGNGTDK